MYTFVADGRNGSAGVGACDTCCCEPANGIPCESNLWQIVYSPWSAPIGKLREVTHVAIEETTTASNALPVNTNYAFSTEVGVNITGDVNTNAVAGTGGTGPLTYALHPLNKDIAGDLTLNSDGTFTFVPNTASMGTQDVWFIVTDANENQSSFLLRIVVVAAGATVPAAVVYDPPKVDIRNNRIMYDVHSGIVKMPVTINPNANVGENHRVTIKQFAIDCDANEYSHVMCVDLAITKCK